MSFIVGFVNKGNFMDKIIQLVSSAFSAKKEYGPNSEEFKAAQLAAHEEIDRCCIVGTNELCGTGEKNGAGLEVGVRIQKKGEGCMACSYVLEVIQPKKENQAEEKKKSSSHPWLPNC